jgi:hypothetical protein
MPGGVYRQTGQHGNYDQTQAVWKASLAVAPGDLVFRDTADGYDKSAALYTWDTDIATTQASFHDVFRGVSMARRTTLQTTDGGIADGNIIESGEFVMPCAALGSAAVVGEYVAPAKATGNALEPQKVAITATLGNAIGVVSRDAAVGATFLYFKIKPVLSAERGVQAVS